MSSNKLGQILIVDDEVELKNALVETLSAQGYEVVGYTSGKDALESLREQNFDVLLSDLMMPDMDGIALLREALQIDPHLVGIVMTGQGTIQTAVDAMKVGAFDYVLKPFRLQALLPTLTRAINSRRLHQENLQLRETVAIYELSRTIAFTLDQRTVLSKLADAASRQINGDAISILLPTEDGSELYVAAVRGANRERLLGERVPLEKSISGWVARERQPILLDGQIDDARFTTLFPRPDIRSAISVPMQIAGKLVGVINIDSESSPRPFTLGQMKSLTILASTAAAALESASLYEQVRRAEKNYRSIFENAIEGIFQSTTDGRFITVNPSMARILGYDSPEEVTASITDIGHQLYVDPERRAESARIQKAHGVLQGFEFEAYRKDGEKIWLSLNRRSIRDADGAEIYREGSVEDITERKRSEQALRESEDRYRDIVEHSHDLICTHDLGGRILSVNQMAARVLGYDRDALIGQDIRDALLPEFRDQFTDYIAKIQKDGIARGLMTVQTKHRETRVWEYINTLRIDGVDVPIVRGIAHDVTEQRSAEEGLRESEERYRVMAETATDVIVTIDENSTILFANGAVERVFGYAVSELVGEQLTMLMPAHLGDLHKEGISRYVATDLKHINWESVELPGRHKNGREIPLELSFGEYREHGKHHFTGIARDITERKRAAEELQKSEERYRDLVENARDMIYTHDLSGNYTSINKAGEQITGYSRDETLKMSLTQTVAAEYLEKVRGMIAGKLAGREETVYDLDIIAKDGRRITVEVNTRLVYQDGVPIGMQGIARDVTGRKRIEEMQQRRAAQTALRGDIGAALAESDTSLQRILEHCAEAVVQHLGAAFARIWTFDKEEGVLELQASAGMYTHIDGPHSRVPLGALKIGLIAQERRPHISNDVQTDARVSDKEWARREGMIAFAGYPLNVEERLVGVLAMFARKRLADDTIDALASIADVISQGIERKRAEEALGKTAEELRHAQKMDAIGQLAGGIAHDFNNLLTAITGYSELALRKLQSEDPLRHYIDEIRKAGDRAAALTRQLLAFSRKQVLQPRVLNLNTVISELEKMLRRLIGEDIELRYVPGSDLGSIKADPGQIEQVIMNLAINGRDAMPQGGKLTIETENVNLSDEYAVGHIAVSPGPYVMLAVSDTGIGMDEKTRSRIFEPFFTTKEVGKGTGLGLSTVYGIVKQSGANIWVYSEIDHGTTFKIYLPRVDEGAPAYTRTSDVEVSLQGTETILLAEDDKVVRTLAREILQTYGYQVLEAANGGAAFLICERYEAPIHLVITDVIMPEMNGRDLAERLRKLRPEMKVLYMSGYTDNAITQQGMLDEGSNFIQKPFSPDAMGRKVREVLGESILDDK